MNKRIEAILKMLENSAISGWILDGDRKIIYMNRVMKELFGDLLGQNVSIIYDCGSYEIVDQAEGETSGLSEIIISDVPFRRFSSVVDLGEGGRYRVELFEDISEHKLVYNNMTQALAKLNAETRMAKTIQNSILPVDDTYWNTIAFSALYMPADDLGGDFYDLQKLNDDEYLIYIADVAGHGIQAALLTVFMRERVRTNTGAALAGTGRLLEKLVQDFRALDIDGMMYVTMAICKYKKSRRELQISNAGHNCCPLIIRDDRETEIITVRGMPVCVIADEAVYEEETISMDPGDRLVLFTDGVVEEIDSLTGRSLGTEGVLELAVKYHDFHGGYVARKIMDESARYSLISAKDDRSLVIVDILS